MKPQFHAAELVYSKVTRSTHSSPKIVDVTAMYGAQIKKTYVPRNAMNPKERKRLRVSA